MVCAHSACLFHSLLATTLAVETGLMLDNTNKVVASTECPLLPIPVIEAKTFPETEGTVEG